MEKKELAMTFLLREKGSPNPRVDFSKLVWLKFL